MTLDEILEAFMAAEAGLSVEAPDGGGPVSLAHIYRLLPDGDASIETPAIFHQFRHMSHRRGPNGEVYDAFDIRVELVVCNEQAAELAYWSHIAALFHNALMDRFDTKILLNSTSTYQRIVSEQEDWQPGFITWLRANYVGCEYMFRVSDHVNKVLS